MQFGKLCINQLDRSLYRGDKPEQAKDLDVM